MRHARQVRLVSGFTLIELLVVVLVIGLLLGCTPALYLLRGRDNATVCKANLRSWGSIWRTHIDEHDGTFPVENRVGWGRGEWALNLREYWSEEDSIRLCPSANTRLPFEKGVVAWGSYNHSYVHGNYGGKPGEEFSYGYNLWMYSRVAQEN